MSTDSVQTTEVPGEDAPPVTAPSRRRLIAGVALAAVIVLYAGFAWAMSSRVPNGTTVAGADLGGQSRDSAIKRLETAASAQLNGGLPVIANGHTATLDLNSAGLSLDAGATLDELTGFSLNPVSLLKQFFGGGDQPALPAPDQAVLEAALAGIAEAVAAPAANASIAYVKGKPVLTPAVTGTELKPADAAVEVRRSRWTRS